MKIADFRSDTVTRPTQAMREVMSAADVGDDVYEDDPTVNELQNVAANLTGKECALFTASGTMSNAIAMKVHANPGDQVLMDEESHSMVYEVGLPATIAQVLTRQFHSVNGVPDTATIAAWLHAETLHTPRTSLVILENTHNRAGGTVIPLGVCKEVYETAKMDGAAVHLDGARIFNASVASGKTVRQYADYADSITFCLSKGLGCPVGSVLCGSSGFITRARRVRKMLGGGMRQAGILAAAGLYALKNNVSRLADDHRRAKLLAGAFLDTATIKPVVVNPETNMVYFNTNLPAQEVCSHLAENHNVLCNPTALHTLRMVTHLDIDDEAIEMAISALRAVCK